ncbi:hypothetical protein QL285_049634 [Trifolium repens]|jgi:hypothetical protein|nr:hypothetical protein QL285_049634 [Trifolium repens]
MDVFFLNCVQANDDLSLSEEQDVTELKEILMSVHLNLNSSDRWRWMADSTGLFLVKNCYKLLQQIGSAEDFSSTLLEAFKKLWKNDVPSKVSIFGLERRNSCMSSPLTLNS